MSPKKDGKGKSKNRKSAAPKETNERQRAVKVTATEKDRVAILEFIGLHYDKLYAKGRNTPAKTTAWDVLYKECHR